MDGGDGRRRSWGVYGAAGADTLVPGAVCRRGGGVSGVCIPAAQKCMNTPTTTSVPIIHIHADPTPPTDHPYLRRRAPRLPHPLPHLRALPNPRAQLLGPQRRDPRHPLQPHQRRRVPSIPQMAHRGSTPSLPCSLQAQSSRRGDGNRDRLPADHVHADHLHGGREGDQRQPGIVSVGALDGGVCGVCVFVFVSQCKVEDVE